MAASHTRRYNKLTEPEGAPPLGATGATICSGSQPRVAAGPLFYCKRRSNSEGVSLNMLSDPRFGAAVSSSMYSRMSMSADAFTRLNSTPCRSSRSGCFSSVHHGQAKAVAATRTRSHTSCSSAQWAVLTSPSPLTARSRRFAWSDLDRPFTSLPKCGQCKGI
jgi:hypothetical protein